MQIVYEVVLWYIGHAKYIPSIDSIDIYMYMYKCKTFYCAFSFLGHGLYMYARCSNLANFRFTYTRVFLYARNFQGIHLSRSNVHR